MAFGRTGGEEGCGRSNGGRGWLWMVAKKRCARVEAPSFPAGDLELVIKYKEPCFARSQLVLAPSLFLARPRLLASPFGMPGIQRGLYLIRDFIRFTSSRGLGAVELGANDRLTPSPRLPGNGIASVMERQFLMEIFKFSKSPFYAPCSLDTRFEITERLHVPNFKLSP